MTTRLPSPTRAPRSVVLILASALIGCGGGGSSSPTATSPNAPVISNPSGEFLLRNTCQTDVGGGSLQLLLFDYTDPDGNVQGGRVEVTGGFFDSAAPQTLTFEVPSQTVSTTGTTSGQIALAICITFGESRQLSETIVLFDATDNRSNRLSITVVTPAGAAETAGRR